MGYNQLINGVYWGYNPLTNHLLTSCDIQVHVDVTKKSNSSRLSRGNTPQWKLPALAVPTGVTRVGVVGVERTVVGNGEETTGGKTRGGCVPSHRMVTWELDLMMRFFLFIFLFYFYP